MHFTLVAMRELKDTILERKQRVVITTTDILARVDMRPMLTDDYGTGGNLLSSKALNAKPLCSGITSVT